MIVLNKAEYDSLIQRIYMLELQVSQLIQTANASPVTIYPNIAKWQPYCSTCGRNVQSGYVCGNSYCPHKTAFMY